MDDANGDLAPAPNSPPAVCVDPPVADAVDVVFVDPKSPPEKGLLALVVGGALPADVVVREPKSPDVAGAVVVDAAPVVLKSPPACGGLLVLPNRVPPLPPLCPNGDGVPDNDAAPVFVVLDPTFPKRD